MSVLLSEGEPPLSSTVGVNAPAITLHYRHVERREATPEHHRRHYHPSRCRLDDVKEKGVSRRCCSCRKQIREARRHATSVYGTPSKKQEGETDALLCHRPCREELVGEKKMEAEAAARCSASAKLESKVTVAAWRRWEEQRGEHRHCCLLLRDEVRREGRCCVHGRMPGRSPAATLSIVDDRCYTPTGIVKTRERETRGRK
nr:hypothetical protein Iba_chr13eCG9250 [Ipomoea batatas]